MKGNEDKMFKDTIALGNKNKGLIPRVKNWCSHIVIEDISGGLVAEMYKLPINLRISCPHATGAFKAMNFEWNAHNFIIDSCPACAFHNEVHKENFGREVIKEYQTHQEKLKKDENEEAQKKLELKEKVKSLIEKEKSKAEITELSILNLIQTISIDEDRKNVAKQILVASKLSPDFFGDIALDYLSLFFDDEDIGIEVLKATQNVLHSEKTLPSFSFYRLKSAIEKGRHIDEVAGVLKSAIKGNDISNYESLLKQIMDSLWYKRHIGDPYDCRPSYPNSISLLIETHEQAPDLLFNLLDERLKINDKTTRINTNYLLQGLIVADSDSVVPHCETIIKSLELEDDDYEESADAITCLTLSELYMSDQNTVMAQVDVLYPTLTEGAKAEFIYFFELVLLKDDLGCEFQEYAESIIEKLLQTIFAKESTKELRKEVLSVLEEVSKKRPTLLSNSFDSLVGCLVDQNKAYSTFNWYLHELKDSDGKISTFNPLQGKSYWEIELERMGIEQAIKKVELIVGNLISNDISSNIYHKIIETISNLDSSSDGLLKSKLIAVIRRSIKEPFQLAEQLPSIYNFLLDPNSKDVRYEAINFVTHLIEEYDQLVTHTIIDMIKVFMNDVDIGIRGKAIEAFGSVIEKFPNEVEEEQIQIILKSVVDSYVVIHKKAARLAYNIFPFLNEDQKLLLISRITALEKSYYVEKEYIFCEELVNILLFLTRKNTKMYSQIVHNYVAKYCDSKDYYTDADFIKKLTFIRSQNDEFNKVWLEQSLGFLFRTIPDYHNPSFDSRKALLTTIYIMPKQIIVDQLNIIKELILQKIQTGHFSDVFELFGVLAYFRQYKLLQELSSYFDKTVQKNKSNESAIEKNEKYGKIADLELRVWNQQIDKTFLNSLNRR
ncbi:hypothetical protein PZB74_01945 [Porifericola rhodea]|uniref:hypothetical protein n=1 Tax=Porifericola rhodea TaxID=930972 RepID=UPI002665BFD0|nr:hypothetical protein [Porifericola rhodea]WKN32114.1 hypothetical protein PZB74_01945 [Porifericola rhodea]